MTKPTISWDETTPAGSDNLNQGDNRVRELKTQIREVIDVDHDFPSSGQAADVGQHKKCTFQEQADLGTGAANATILGSQTVSGKGELVYTDEDDNDVQITSQGKIGAAGVDLLGNDLDLDGTLTSDNITLDTNNTYLKAKDNAGTGTVDLIKADTNDVAVVPDGTQTATNAAPSDDKDLANKKYVDDSVTDIGAIEDYATSESTGTAKNLSDLKVVYGTASVSADSTDTISGLGFTSSGTYSVTANYAGETGTTIIGSPHINIVDGASFQITNPDGSVHSIHWMAIGT